MTEDNLPRVSSGESTASIYSSATKQRKKREWDQPAEALASAGVAAPGILPLGNMVSLAGITVPAAASASGAILANPLTASPATIPPQVFQVPLVQPHATAVVQKINQQPKIQDELIAREIVINDADSAVRYKLTKRQTQEEIQKCTGAVVITRGKYRPPNAPSDGEKPLYLHISAGAHLDTTVERIKAVDLAASMVEEMLKQGFFSNGGKVGHLLSTCVYLGFEADPSLNIAARIRGPNDQYVNHIMNETGATVSLRGRGSGNSESAFSEEEEQALHLFLLSNNPKSLESAKLLAENLLDTISRDCGASRVSSCKVYAAVPPPQQLLAGIPSSGDEAQSNCSPAASLTLSAVNYAAIPPVSSAMQHGSATSIIQGTLSQSMGLSSGPSQTNMVCHPQPLLANGTSYSGYGGIYPQATPLQQVALALRQSPSSVNSTVAPATTAAFTEANSSKSLSSEEKRRPQKRKFQELPVAPKGRANPHQNSLLGSEYLKPGEPTSDLGVINTSKMRTSKKLVQPSTHEMPPPPPRTMPPPLPPPKFNSSMPAMKVLERTMPLPPPPPKFNSSVPATKVVERTMPPPPPPPKFNASDQKSKPEAVPDTLIKLMEYGEEDDDPDEVSGEPYKNNTNGVAAPKPFWAV